MVRRIPRDHWMKKYPAQRRTPSPSWSRSRSHPPSGSIATKMSWAEKASKKLRECQPRRARRRAEFQSFGPADGQLRGPLTLVSSFSLVVQWRKRCDGQRPTPHALMPTPCCSADPEGQIRCRHPRGDRHPTGDRRPEGPTPRVRLPMVISFNAWITGKYNGTEDTVLLPSCRPETGPCPQGGHHRCHPAATRFCRSTLPARIQWRHRCKDTSTSLCARETLTRPRGTWRSRPTGWKEPRRGRLHRRRWIVRCRLSPRNWSRRAKLRMLLKPLPLRCRKGKLY
mmetsp:Transcript_47800/g.133272  ORF Transcript_47800/g.133272 Transcript_47800/m.133272 type:complete len:283 (+) Transcript_47800:445-1293(+)